jgi:hypothetical protein
MTLLRLLRTCLVAMVATAWVLVPAGSASADCPIFRPNCLEAGLGGGAASISMTLDQAGRVLVGRPQIPDYQWRFRHLCVIHDEAAGACSPSDFRQCPEESGRVIRYLVLEQQPLVRVDLTAAPSADGRETLVGPGLRPGDPVGFWGRADQGCFDITELNPAPSPDEVFSYFQRLPLPALVTQHQPPGDGLAGLPVIFYTDSPTTQTFTVDIRGFTVTIDATAQQFTWHTGDATGQIVTTDPGQPYPDHTIEHDYRSGSYTAHLTVTWGATFTVNGSAPADVPGTTTTDGPPVTFDVLQARTVLTNPFD